MPTVHFLNVGNGDCIIIEHGSNHVTMIDICSGNLVEKRAESLAALMEEKLKGNFQMCDKPTNPISYLKKIGHNSLFRFILSFGLFKPSKYLTFSVHLDGQREHHDFSVCREGGYDKAVEGIREAVKRGFRVTPNATLFDGADPTSVRAFFDEVMASEPTVK